MINWEWLAGFFEGEGSVGCYRRVEGKYKSYSFTVSVSQNELKILKRIKRFVGYGSIFKYKDGRNSFTKKPLWAYCCQNSYAIEFCNRVLPYINSDKRKSQIKTAFRNLKKFRKHKCPVVRQKT